MEFERILLDTNLLVLWIVGRVSPNLIVGFKRTTAYDEKAFQLLVRILARTKAIATTPHVLAETSNLIDLGGKLQVPARREFADIVKNSRELGIAGIEAIEHPTHDRLGLADAAIHLAARGAEATVLTDDLDLYLSLEKHKILAFNFSYLRAQAI